MAKATILEALKEPRYIVIGRKTTRKPAYFGRLPPWAKGKDFEERAKKATVAQLIQWARLTKVAKEISERKEYTEGLLHYLPAGYYITDFNLKVGAELRKKGPTGYAMSKEELYLRRKEKRGVPARAEETLRKLEELISEKKAERGAVTPPPVTF